ncbi:hypothetical protein [Acidovorax delafieldii]|uniref:hypothetical protein n=1 Tax=Acidovorax delafieldii TaxID=47920 RepID=UPI003ECFC8A7
MQSYQQTFAANTTWQMNVSGSYYSTLECTLPVNVRFYKGGTLLDLGEIKGLLAGLEVDFGRGGNAFDRVEIDVQAGDTVKIGIGNGQARYNRGAATVTVSQNKVAQSSTFDNLQKTVTTASAVLLAANTSRQALQIQNKDPAGTIWLAFGKAATQAAGVRVIPGGVYEPPAGVCPTGAIYAIGDIASNTNITTVEG